MWCVLQRSSPHPGRSSRILNPRSQSVTQVHARLLIRSVSISFLIIKQKEMGREKNKYREENFHKWECSLRCERVHEHAQLKDTPSLTAKSNTSWDMRRGAFSVFNSVFALLVAVLPSACLCESSEGPKVSHLVHNARLESSSQRVRPRMAEKCAPRCIHAHHSAADVATFRLSRHSARFSATFSASEMRRAPRVDEWLRNRTQAQARSTGRQ